MCTLGGPLFCPLVGSQWGDTPADVVSAEAEAEEAKTESPPADHNGYQVASAKASYVTRKLVIDYEYRPGQFIEPIGH